MTSTSTRNLSALRASLKHEDAALENRMPATRAATQARPLATASTRSGAKTAIPESRKADATAKPAATKPAQRKPVATAPAQVQSAMPAAVAKPAAAKVAAKPTNAKALAKPAAAKPAKAPSKPAAPRQPAPRAAGTTTSKPGAGAPPSVKAAPANGTARPMAGGVKGKDAKPAGGRKAKSDKLVKDTFEMPRSERAQLKSLRTGLAAKGVDCTKSGVLRAGLAALLKLDEAGLNALAQDFAKAPKGKRGKKG